MAKTKITGTGVAKTKITGTGIINLVARGEDVTLTTDAPFPKWAEVTLMTVDDSRKSPIAQMRPIVQLRVEVQEGQPVVTRLTLGRGGPDHPPITATTLEGVDFGAILERVVRALAQTAYLEKTRPTAHLGPPYAPEEEAALTDARNRASAARRRRLVNDQLLREVAETVKANPKKQTIAVQNGQHTSHRNATRYIAAARKRGFLPEEN